jgi:isoaspartyl peptidase/L-asparaginase-like protein (Ntn-hydrolase superfamily)
MLPPLSSAVLTFSNRFGFVTIVEAMEFSDEDSDYFEEASNEVNDENKKSPSYNVVDVSAYTYESTNESEINDGTIGVIIVEQN